MNTLHETKTVSGRFFRWDYRAECRRLEEASAQGWQLTRRTPWKSEYTYDPTVRYRYAIDFRRDHDEVRYLDTCREMGWELAAALGDATSLLGGSNGHGWAKNNLFTPQSHPADGKWYIFRKPYDPEAPEAEYNLDTAEQMAETVAQQLSRKQSWWLVFYILCITTIHFLTFQSLVLFLVTLAAFALVLPLAVQWVAGRILRQPTQRPALRRLLIFFSDLNLAVPPLVFLLLVLFTLSRTGIFS